MSRIRLITLDAPRCFHDSTDNDLPLKRRRFALLVYLAMERSAPRERIATMFSPEVDEARAYGRLKQSVYELRQAFGMDCIQTRGSELSVHDSLTIDACDFGAFAEGGDYRRAIELYQRPFLDGFYLTGASGWERWVDRRRAVLARVYVQSARALVNAQLEKRDFDGAIACAQRWIELDEHNYSAHRVHMTALVAAGRTDAALSHYAELERRLMRTEGEQPPDELREFAEEIRRGLIGHRHNGRVLRWPDQKSAKVSATSTVSLPVLRSARRGFRGSHLRNLGGGLLRSGTT
jgi:DNA-binding SARP family transcriptional activator